MQADMNVARSYQVRKSVTDNRFVFTVTSTTFCWRKGCETKIAYQKGFQITVSNAMISIAIHRCK